MENNIGYDIEKKYFNFPIQLLKDFMLHPNKCLYNIFCYAHYAHSLYYTENAEGEISEDELIASANRFFGICMEEDPEDVYRIGENLYHLYHSNSPKTGIRVEVWNNYFEYQKTDFELVCLLGFLALKSIIGPHTFFKTNSLFWMSRMDGNVKTVTNGDKLSPEIRFYLKRYQRDKIISELQNNWGLRYFGARMRGFYVSFDLCKNELVYVALQRRKKAIEKKRKIEEMEAVKEAKRRLGL